MKQDSLVESVQVIPIQDLVAYRVIQEKTFEKLDVPFLRVTTYKDGTIAIYPVNMQQIATEHILQQNEIDIYWDWLEYKGEPYGDNISELYYNPFPTKSF
jgi:hypothetical protein